MSRWCEVKFLGFAGIFFIYWKVASKKLPQNRLFITVYLCRFCVTYVSYSDLFSLSLII